jgi:hypothetical protein
MRRVAIVILSTLLMAACTSIDCPLSNTVSAVYQLQTPSGAPDTLKIDTMWVWAERANGTDTLLVNRLCGTNATKVSIPMSYMQEFDNIHIEIRDTNVHTSQNIWVDDICIQKENYPHFESVDCKAMYYHRLKSVTTTNNIIDTLIINKTEVTNDASTAHFLLRLKARR